jgi:hypothetical protein
MPVIGRNSAVAAVGKKRHELDGPIAFAAWLGVHALLMASGNESKLSSIPIDEDRKIAVSGGTDTRLTWTCTAEHTKSFLPV